jgi:hypothetical protein
MDYGAVITDSAEYTREALAGKWVRWLIFVICGLPFALIAFVFDPKKIVSGATIRWDLVAWDQVAALCIAGLLLSFIVAGYIARIYRGAKIPPEFDNWGSLYVDGIKIAVVGFIWYIPLILVVAVLFGIAIIGMAAGMASGSMASMGLILALMLLTLLVEFVLIIVIFLFAVPGMIRFARTGSIREGIRFSKIKEIIGIIGWGSYIIALLIMIVCAVIFIIITTILAMIPYAGWIIQLVLSPLYSVFIARYMSLVYDHGEPRPVESAAP